MYMTAGRVLGGSSSVNYMTYVRGFRPDYDQWAAQGCQGWSYDDLLPYFIKSERMEDVDYVDTGEMKSRLYSCILILYPFFFSLSFCSLSVF